MAAYFRLSIVGTVLSTIVLFMQQPGTITFTATLIALVCCLVVCIVSAILLRKNKIGR